MHTCVVGKKVKWGSLFWRKQQIIRISQTVVYSGFGLLILSGYLISVMMLIPNKKGRWTSYHLNVDYVIQPEQMGLAEVAAAEVQIKNQTDQTIYDYIRTNGFITANQVLDITRINTTQGANVALGRLMKADLIVMVRKGRH